MSNIPIKQQFSRGSLEKARPANDRQEAYHEPT